MASTRKACARAANSWPGDSQRNGDEASPLTVAHATPWGAAVAARLHNPVTSPYKVARVLLCSTFEQPRRLERRIERPRFAERMASLGAQRGLSSAELLSVVVVVLAGRHQGGFSRPREHRRQLRQGGAQPELRDAAAERGIAQDLREALHQSGLHPVQRVSARPVLMPVLRLGG